MEALAKQAQKIGIASLEPTGESGRLWHRLHVAKTKEIYYLEAYQMFFPANLLNPESD